MNSIIWLDPINRDAQTLKLIAEEIYQQSLNTSFNFQVITTNRNQMELSEMVPFRPFFRNFSSLHLGKVHPLKKLQILLEYYGSFNRIAGQLDDNTILLYSSGVSLPRLELIGLNKLRKKAKSVNMLVHNFEDKQRQLSWFGKTSKNDKFFTSFDRLIFLSEHMRNEALTRFNVEFEKTHVMLHPHFHPMLDKIEPNIELASQIKQMSEDKPIVAYVSRLDLDHGIDIFYQTLAQLDVYGVVLGRLGAGWTLESNQTCVEKLGIDSSKVFLKIGNYSYSELLAVLNLSDFVLAPYRQISQSAAIALALGEKVPVVASNVGANGEMVKDGVNGILFSGNDLDSLWQAIKLIYSTGKTMRDRFLPTPSFNSHLDPELAVKNMVNWLMR
ncbi:glycosyltransferase family 4 protein [Chrysosporum bergii ANA360D]|uniref:Glycosyltransferase family 4 protein n=1 Tax=Chrysosporum bergii ANA360D TaxID=617107 RepID=A0AA43GPP9_9CYAN|nr:glycosyltransferase family 4 protein [Chrysosporum bergii]MDH6059468.1 glycosyltransferase family 4 protein [Chrysosporum bergii ANA360D]